MEFVGSLPLLMLVATVFLQALLIALALVFAQSAADRAARGMPGAHALDSIPRGWRSRARIEQRGERVHVRISPPALLPGAAGLLSVQASSSVAP